MPGLICALTFTSKNTKAQKDKQKNLASSFRSLCALREHRGEIPAYANTSINNHWAPAVSTFQTHGSCFQYSPDLRNCNTDYYR